MEKSLLVPVTTRGHGDNGDRAGVPDIRTTQQGQQVEAVGSRHLNVGKQQVIILAPHRLDYIFGGCAGRTIHAVALQHFLYHVQ